MNGDAMALGHVVWADHQTSGVMVLILKFYSMADSQAQKGGAAVSVGGGMGVSMCIERCWILSSISYVVQWR